MVLGTMVGAVALALLVGFALGVAAAVGLFFCVRRISEKNEPRSIPEDFTQEPEPGPAPNARKKPTLEEQLRAALEYDGKPKRNGVIEHEN